MSLCLLFQIVYYSKMQEGNKHHFGYISTTDDIDLRLVDTIFTKSLILSLASVVDNVLWSYVYIVQNVQIICKDSYPQYYLCVE